MGLDLGSQGYSNASAAAGENQIENAYYDSFRAGFEQAFQQTESKLQPYFETESQSSEFQFFDRIGEAAAMTEDTGRYAVNPQSEINHERRRLGLGRRRTAKGAPVQRPLPLLRLLLRATQRR